MVAWGIKRRGETYVHELLHLFALHARLEFALLRGIESESVGGEGVRIGYVIFWIHLPLPRID